MLVKLFEVASYAMPEPYFSGLFGIIILVGFSVHMTWCLQRLD